MNIWPLILRLNETCLEQGDPGFISIKLDDDDFTISINEQEEDSDICIVTGESVKPDLKARLVAHCKGPFIVEILKQELFDLQTENFMKSYLPYALLPYFASRQDKIFVISHFAQTLDGKIASVSGDSKWIGNQENLIHAHRMRALCDAVLVGSATYEIDNPRLNVRHVEGKDPLKVVVGSRGVTQQQYEEKVFLDTVEFRDASEYEKDVDDILEPLKRKGVKTVYLEGGSSTSSAFLRQGKIDQVQIHFSPKILGSGKQGYIFEGISSIEECIRFNNPRFVPVGEEVMFLGEL